MRLRHGVSRTDVARWARRWVPSRRERADDGDTLVEILVSITIVGVAAVAILLAFGTSITGSGVHRSAVNLDTALRTASAEAQAQIADQPASAFTTCSAASAVSPSAFNLSGGYTAQVSSVQYWNGTSWTGLQTPGAGCPPGLPPLSTTSGLQLLTLTVTSAKGQSASTTAVASNPVAPSGGSTCTSPQKLVWVSQPGNGLAGQALFPTPAVAIEDNSGTPCTNDATSVSLSIASGPSGANLSNCVKSSGNGETAFLNCSINTLGSGYTLVASDSVDNLTSVASTSFSITAGIPVKLVFQQSPSNGTGGTAFPTQPIVDIEDSAGNLVAGDTSTVTLAMGTNAGNGTLSGCSSTTTNGVATFSGCKIDKVGTGYTLTATDTADNLTTPSSPTNGFNITPGPAAQLAFTATPTTTVVGDPLAPQPAVAVEDAGGNVTTTNMGTVSLGIGTNAGGTGAALSGCTQTTSGGTVTFASCSINKIGTGYTLAATDGSLTPATSGTFNVVTAALTSFKVSPQTTTPTAGSAFNVTVTGLDQSGYTYPNLTGTQTIAFTGPANSPNGTAPIYPATVSFSNGVGTASVTLYDAQTTQVTATKGTVTGTSGSITVGANTTTTGFTVVNPGGQVAGTAFNVTIDAVDQYGNTVTSYTGGKTLTFGGPSNAPNGTSPTYPSSHFGSNVTFTNGSATPSITLVDAQTTSLTVTQSSTGYTGTSSNFTVSAGGASNIQLSNPATQTAGTAFPVTISAFDAYGNTATGVSGQQAMTFSGPSNSPNGTAPLYPGSVNFANGVGQANVTLYDAQTTTLTGTLGSLSDATNSFTINSTGHVGSFVVANPGTQTAGTSFGVSITAGDPYGNKVTSYTGSQTLAFSGPSNAPNGQAPAYPASATFSSGVASATVTLYDAQSTALTVTQGSTTGTSSQFAVQGAATAASFSVANPGNQTAGAAFNVSVTAVDQWGNTASGYSGSKTLTFSGPSNAPGGQAPSYPSTVTFSSGAGTASVTLYDVQTTSLTVTQSSASGNSGSFVVGPATPKSFTFSTPGTQTTGAAFNVTITAVDQWGNTTPSYSGPQTVTFSGPSSSPNGTAPHYPASVTFSGGVGTASITLYDAQNTSLTATQGSLTGSTGSFAVNGTGTAASFNLSTPSPTAGSSFTETITAVDQYGNTATGYTGSKTVTFGGPANAPGGQAPSYPSSVTFSGGAGTASITLYNAQSVTLVATQGSLTGSTSVTVAPASASTFTVANPGTQTAGTSFSVTLTALDQYGNQATGYTGSKTVSFSGPATAPSGQAPLYPSSVSFSSGVGTASITLYDAQSTTLTATQGSSVSGTSTAFTVNGAGANSFSVSNPGTVTAGSPFNVTLSALDAYGNNAPTYTGTKAVTFSGASSAPGGQAPSYPSSVTFSGGSGTASITLYDAQSLTLRAGQGSIAGTTNFTVAPASAASFSLPTPGTQTAGTAFNVTITALDQYGNTASGYTGAKTVTFSGPANAPNGTAPSYPSSVSFSSGVGTASVTLYDAQSSTLSATQGLLTGATGSFTVAGSATPGRFTVANPGTQTAGTAFGVTITAFDQYGNQASGYTGSQTLAFSGPSNAPSGQAPSYPSSVTFSGGVGTASLTLYDAQSTTLTATQGTVSGTSTAFTVSAGGASSYSVSNPGTVTAGSAFNVTLTALDAYGNNAPTYTGTKTVTFSGASSAPGGQAPSYPSSVTFSGGSGTASITLYDAQSVTLRAAQGSIAGTTTFTVAPASAASFSLPTPGTQTAGTAFNETLTALDQYGNTATGYTGSQSLTFSGPANAPGGQAPTYPASVTFSGGVGTASITLYDAQSTTLRATQSLLTGVTGSFTVSANATPGRFTVSTPSTQTAGTAFNVTITVFDQYGNQATGYTGAKTIAFSGPSSSPNGTAPSYPSSVTFSGGAGSASITLYDAQTTSITATQGGATGSTATFTVNSAVAKSYALSNPGTQSAGTAFNVTITAADQWGNTATSYTGSPTVTFSGPSSSPNGHAPSYPSSVSFSSGIAIVSITLYDAQSTSITATQSLVSGSTGSFTVNPISASSFTLPTPGTQTAGTAFNETVTAVDTYGNTAASYAGSKSVTFSGPASSPSGQAPSYPASVTFTSGVGTASVTLYDAQSTSITATQSTLTGATGAFTVSSGAASTFAVPTPATQTAGTAFNETLTAQDTWGNTATGYTGSQTVTFSGPSSSPNGTAPLYPSSVTFTSGVGTASIKLYEAQSTSLTATQSSVSGTSGTFTVNGLSTTSTFILSTPTPTAGSAFTETITAADTYGNKTTGYTGSKAMTFSGPSSSPGGNAPSYPSTVTFSSGVGTTTITLYDVQSTTLTATSGTVTGTSASFTVSPAVAVKFAVANPGTQTAGSSFNLTLTAQDTYGNTATTYSGSKTMTFSGPSSSPGGNAPSYPSTVTFSSGAGTASITLYDAQSTSITATQSTLTGNSGTFTVTGGTVSSFSVPTPATQTAGTAFNETLTAVDQYGNTTTSYTGSKTISFSGPSSSPDGTTPTYPSSVTFSSGVGTASITLVNASSSSLTATQGTTSGSSGSFTVNAAAQASLYLTNTTTQPSPAVTCSGPSTNLTTCTSSNEPNTAQTLTSGLELVDTYGNVTTNTTGSAITVSLTKGGTSSSLSPSSLSIANGQSATSSSAQFTLTRGSGGTGTTASVTAKIGTITELTVTLSS